MSTEKGVKLDDNKPRLDLVLGDFATALWGVGLVGTFGANKYCDRGWHEVNNGIERYSNALLRHYLKYKSGEYIDLESGLPHLSHLAWNALAILQLDIEKDVIGTTTKMPSDKLYKAFKLEEIDKRVDELSCPILEEALNKQLKEESEL